MGTLSFPKIKFIYGLLTVDSLHFLYSILLEVNVSVTPKNKLIIINIITIPIISVLFLNNIINKNI